MMHTRVLAAFALLVMSCAATKSSNKVEVSCVSEVPEGKYSMSSADSSITGTFVQGKKDGTFSVFSSSGAQAALIPFHAGQIDGLVRLWFWSETNQGQLKLESTYSAGKLHGQKRSWYPSGDRRGDFTYTSNTLDRAEGWKPDGSPLSAEEAAAMAAHDVDADQHFYNLIVKIIDESLPDCSKKEEGRPTIP